MALGIDLFGLRVRQPPAGPWHTVSVHAGSWSMPASEEPSSLAAPLPSADCPWPFTLREYARLMLLRGRIRQRHPRGALDVPFAGVPRDPARWVCPDWLRQYLHLVTGLRGELVQQLVNDCAADAESDPARARRVDLVRAQVRLLETLHAQGLLRTRS
jgi:hypothetical protein